MTELNEYPFGMNEGSLNSYQRKVRLWREENLKHWMEVQGARKADTIYKQNKLKTKASKGFSKRILDTKQATEAVDFLTGAVLNPNQDFDDAVSREALDLVNKHEIETRRGALKKDQASSELSEMFRDQGVESEQNRWVVTNKEHAKSVSGEPNQKNIASPTGYGDYGEVLKDGSREHRFIKRGSNSARSQFTGSGRYNVTMQDKDSFTSEQMQRLGRPSTPLEDATDFELKERFGTVNPKTKVKELGEWIDITDNDWLRLQQGRITDDQLISHKLAVKDIEAQGFLWVDGEFLDDSIIDIDEQMGRKSLVKHHGERTKRDLRIEQKEWDAKAKKGYTTTKLPRGKFQKLSGRVSKANALTMMGLHVTSGNIPGAIVSATSLSAQLAAENPVVQKKTIDLAAKILARRGATTTAKLIPGVDIYISGREAFDYASRGRFGQAALAALSGAIGWAGPPGDLAAALIDMTNTAIDVSKGDFKSVAQKQSEAQKGDILEINRSKRPKRSMLKSIQQGLRIN